MAPQFKRETNKKSRSARAQRAGQRIQGEDASADGGGGSGDGHGEHIRGGVEGGHLFIFSSDCCF